MKKLKGFTLIELLVVVAIIGILSTVVVVNFSGAQKSARNKAAISNLNEVLSAAQACVSEEGTLSQVSAVAVDPSGKALCGGSTITTNWPSLAGGYTYTITSTAAAVTAVTVTPKAGDSAITCTAVGGLVPSCK